MNFVFKMMDFVVQMMNIVFKMMDFVLQMMNFVLKLIQEASDANGKAFNFANWNVWTFNEMFGFWILNDEFCF